MSSQSDCLEPLQIDLSSVLGNDTEEGNPLSPEQPSRHLKMLQVPSSETTASDIQHPTLISPCNLPNFNIMVSFFGHVLIHQN